MASERYDPEADDEPVTKVGFQLQVLLSQFFSSVLPFSDMHNTKCTPVYPLGSLLTNGSVLPLVHLMIPCYSLCITTTCILMILCYSLRITTTCILTILCHSPRITTTCILMILCYSLRITTSCTLMIPCYSLCITATCILMIP